MVDVASMISNEFVLIGIEVGAAVLLIMAVFYTHKIYQMTKKTTDIWLLINSVVFTAFLVSLANALYLYYNFKTFHGISEYLKNIYSLVWIYIAYRFVSLRRIEKKA